jgi:uncharacterized protein (DUF1810 family)
MPRFWLGSTKTTPNRSSDISMLQSPAFEHFVEAQEPLWEQVVKELRAGRKTSHWMWFIFPQHVDLGRSQMARRFGLASIGEAKAYLQHPVLGPRLIEAAELVLAIKERTAFGVFGSPDDLKLRSSMTLFQAAEPQPSVFEKVLTQYFSSQRDARTLELIGWDKG